MTSKTVRFNQTLARLLVGELGRLGLDQVFLAPGSRNSPLLLAFAEEKKIKSLVHFDERGLGFSALGYAKASGKPGLVCVTSGTAVANLLPAVMEAANDFLPLIVLSADRPSELHGIGANQTIKQEGIFSTYVKKYFHLPPPGDEISWEYYLGLFDEAWALATSGERGPVHINLALREPLVGARAEPINVESEKIKNYLTRQGAWMTWQNAPRKPTAEQIEAFLTILKKAKGYLLCVGGLAGEIETEQVKNLLKEKNLAAYVDVLSGLRVDGLALVTEKLLGHPKVKKLLEDFVIVHIGGRFVSKKIEQFLGQSKCVVRLSSKFDRIDSSLSVRAQWVLDFDFLKNLFEHAPPQNLTLPLDQITRDLLVFQQNLNSGSPAVGESDLPRFFAQILKCPSVLYVGNSLPIRDFSASGYGFNVEVLILGNRGVSGIDGLVASAVGAAIAKKWPTILVIGDLSLLHDLNSLSLIKNTEEAFIVLVVNNQGGGIFSFLPVADADVGFETHIATAHVYDFKAAAGQFLLDYFVLASLQDAENLIGEAITKKQKLFLELKTDRRENHQAHATLDKRLEEKLDALLTHY